METWRVILIAALALNATTGFGYRVYRLTKGGPLGDVTGQAVLGLLLGGLAVAIGLEQGWARWAALIYGILFGLLVMPMWTLAVLFPMKPRGIDYAFTAVYWTALAVIVGAALAL